MVGTRRTCQFRTLDCIHKLQDKEFARATRENDNTMKTRGLQLVSGALALVVRKFLATMVDIGSESLICEPGRSRVSWDK